MANTIVSESVLIESRSARDNQLARISPERVTEILDKVKGIYFAVWRGIGTATTEEMAEFYEVPTDSVQKVIQRHRDELESDGVRTLKGKELKALRSQAMDGLSIPVATTVLTIWTPRAALRLGMLLRDSAIAKAIRTSLLDAVEYGIPAQSTRMRELELELELARARADAARAEDAAATSLERLLAVSQAIATLHGTGMLGLMLGKPEAIVEAPPTVVEKILLVTASGRLVKSYQGLSKTNLAKRYGMKKAADFVAWLQSINKADLLQSGLTAAPCQYVPYEFVAELDRLWSSRQGFRQRLIGE